MEIRELLQKRASLWDEAKKFLDEHTDKDGKISAEDAAAYDKMEADIDAMSKSIERHERNARIGAELDKPFNTPHFEPVNNNSAVSKTGRARDEYKSAFMTMFRTNFRQINNILQESVDTSGGYLVPEEWDSKLIDGLVEENIMRKLGTTITTSGEHKMNMPANKPAALWVAEGGALTFGDATFMQKTLDAHKLHVAVKVTNELLNDNAFGLENFLIEAFIQAISNAEEDAFLNGAPETNGEKTKPTGLFVTASEASNSPKTTKGNEISGDDVIDLVYSLKRPYRKKAAFVLNDATLARIRKIKDQNQAYMWQPSYTQNEPDRLFGFPLYTSAYAPTGENAGPVMAFGDFSYYYIGDRGVRSIKYLQELFAGNDMTGFVMLERVDGVLVLPEAVKVLKMKS